MTLKECFLQNGLGEYLSKEKEEKLLILCRLLLSYNEKVNLTALTGIEDVYAKHIADSAKLLPYISGETLLDVGCGGGFPSLPLSVLNENIRITAMDSTKKKLDFVLYAKENLGLDNITVLNGRAEELCTGALRESFDSVTARAVASLPVLCELCVPYVKTGGLFLAMKTDKTELQTALHAVKETGAEHIKTEEYKLFCEDGPADRCVMIFKKIKNTPVKYPRKYAVIKSRPL